MNSEHLQRSKHHPLLQSRGGSTNLRRGNLSLKDDPRSGRPCTVVTEEHIEMTRNLIKEDARNATQMIETHLGIGSAAVHTILHDHLKVRKICARWIPHMPDQCPERCTC